MSFEETLRQIIREEIEMQLEGIKKLLQMNGQNDHPRLLTVEEAAEILRVGKSTVYELSHHKDFPAFREGRKILIPYSRLMEWIEAQSENESEVV